MQVQLQDEHSRLVMVHTGRPRRDGPGRLDEPSTPTSGALAPLKLHGALQVGMGRP